MPFRGDVKCCNAKCRQIVGTARGTSVHNPRSSRSASYVGFIWSGRRGLCWLREDHWYRRGLEQRGSMAKEITFILLALRSCLDCRSRAECTCRSAALVEISRLYSRTTVGCNTGYNHEDCISLVDARGAILKPSLAFRYRIDSLHLSVTCRE